MTRHELGDYIVECLDNDNRSQSWLADKLGIDRSALRRWFVLGETRITAEKLKHINDYIRADKTKLVELALEIWPEFEHEYLRNFDVKVEPKEIEQIQEEEEPKETKPAFTLPDLPQLKSKTCPIYFELKLGKEERMKDPSDRRERPIFEFPFLMWTERAEDWRKHFTETPAHTLLSQWSNQAGFHPIVGEPGGGKSTLLRYWAHELVKRSTPDRQYLPLLVPLREVDESGIEGFFDKQGFDVKPYLEGKMVDGVQPVWLFDGLDELPKKHKERWTKLTKAQKQHPVLLTCRTALWDSDHRVNFGEPHYLMGMYPREQKTFLLALAEEWRKGERYEYGFEDADEVWVEKLHSKLQSQSSLKQLAGSPLLLTLIARTNKPNNIDLPAKRVEFYQKAFKELLKQREDDEINAWTFIEPLSKLAYEVSKDELRAEFSEGDFEKHTSELNEHQLKVLRKSNILKFGDDGNCQWLHQTFQEWLIAEYLSANYHLLVAVKQYWKDLYYQEILALVWDLSNESEQFETAKYLIAEGCQSCPFDAHRGRSGLKILLSLVTRSTNKIFRSLADLLWANISISLLRKEVIAQSGYTPDFLLEKLSIDSDEYIRVSVAANRNTSKRVLTALSSDVEHVRVQIAKNINTTAQVLCELSSDTIPYIRKCVAAHPNTLTETLVKLADDKNWSVRWAVEANSNTPDYIRQTLSESEDSFSNTFSLSNLFSATKTTTFTSENPQQAVTSLYEKEYFKEIEVLEEIQALEDMEALEDNPDFQLACDDNTQISILAELAETGNLQIQLCVAENLNTSSESLQILAQLQIEEINVLLASNPNTPNQTLATLFQTERFQWDVAINPNSCLEWL